MVFGIKMDSVSFCLGKRALPQRIYCLRGSFLAKMGQLGRASWPFPSRCVAPGAGKGFWLLSVWIAPFRVLLQSKILCLIIGFRRTQSYLHISFEVMVVFSCWNDFTKDKIKFRLVTRDQIASLCDELRIVEDQARFQGGTSREYDYLDSRWLDIPATPCCF